MLFRSSNTLLLALLSLPLTQAYFILNHATLVRTRLDPIVNPSAVAQHEHNIVGGSRFGKDYSYEDVLTAKCTTAEVSVDMSNYWAPQLYYYEPIAKTFQAIPSYTKTYYLQRPGNKNEPIMAFPPGLRMLAGNPNRRTYDPTSFAEQAISFVCLDYYHSHAGDSSWDQTSAGFFQHNCPDGLRTQVFFPSCWDGINLDSSDHKSHMAYPVDNYEGGNCPATHPVHLVSLFYEFVWSVGDFPFNAVGTPTWVLANGDTTGLGFHGDFTNGWPSGNSTEGSLLQNALDTCGLETGGEVDECAVFVPYIDRESAAACNPENEVVNEEVGFGSPISALPGNNLLWIGNSTTKPVAANYTFNGGYTVTSSVLPTGWSNVGCISEATSGRALVAGQKTSANMTLAVCAAYCGGLGLPYAGIEFGDECYCDSALRNGANSTLLNSNECATKCAGLGTENCGGANTLTLLFNPSNVAAAPTLPTGWSAGSCMTEVTNARALPNATTSGSSMTVETCVNFCAGKGFRIAGIEYGQECWCGNSFISGSTVAAFSDCNMPCAGNLDQTCGGPNRLSTYQTSAVVASSSVTSSSSSSTSQSASSTAVSSSKSSSSLFAITSSASPSSGSLSVASSTRSTSSSASIISSSSSTIPSPSSSVLSSSKVTSSSAVVASSSTSSTSAIPSSSSVSIRTSSAIAKSSSSSSTSSKAASSSSSASSSPSSSKIASSSSTASKTSSRLSSSTSSTRSSSSSNISSSSSSKLSTTSSTPSSTPVSQTSSSVASSSSSVVSSSSTKIFTTSTSLSSSTQVSTTSTSTSSSVAALPSSTSILPGWSNVGCIAEAASGRAMVAGYKADSVNMTLTACASYCGGLGLPYAGVEYGQECYCDSVMRNGASLTFLPASECSMKCKGSSTQLCGGSNRLTLLYNPDNVPAPPSLPAGWTAGSCMTEATNARALSGASTSGSSMTIESCTNFCSGKGFSIAGIEYGQECWCGNSFGAGSVVAPSSECNKPCSGQLSTTCGGSNRLSTYQKSATTTTTKRRRGVWASSRL